MLVVAWVVAVWPSVLSLSALDGYATKIARGASFRDGTLRELRPELDSARNLRFAHPEVSRDVALIELRMAETSLGQGRDLRSDPQFARAYAATEQALRYNPSDGFLWYAMFWLAKQQRGFRADQVPYLERSYASSPNEGWVAVHRNRDAVAVLPLLPSALQGEVVEEFCHLVAAGYVDDASAILVGPGWAQRQALLGCLPKVSEPQRRALAQRLANRGVDLAIPGLPVRPQHPWEFAPG